MDLATLIWVPSFHCIGMGRNSFVTRASMDISLSGDNSFLVWTIPLTRLLVQGPLLKVNTLPNCATSSSTGHAHLHSQKLDLTPWLTLELCRLRIRPWWLRILKPEDVMSIVTQITVKLKYCCRSFALYIYFFYVRKMFSSDMHKHKLQISSVQQ